jgi:hypothetical protein
MLLCLPFFEYVFQCGSSFNMIRLYYVVSGFCMVNMISTAIDVVSDTYSVIVFQVVRMLIVVVGTFTTLWLPYRAMVVYNSFAATKMLDLWFLLFCRTMVYINSAINPILYNAMSVKFRRAFRRVLCCGKYLFYYWDIGG